MELQSSQNGSTKLQTNHYELIDKRGCKGYEIALAGIRNYTFSKVKLYGVGCYGKNVFLDADCKDCKKSDVNIFFNKLNESIAETLLVYP